MTTNHRIAIGAALLGVAAMSLAVPPTAGAAMATDLPPCSAKVVVNCSPVTIKATVPKGYKMPKKPKGY